MPDRLMGCPNTVPHIMQACSFHVAKVDNVNDSTGSGRVQVISPGPHGIAKSNFIQVASTNCGNDNASKHHSGIWNPAQPGGYGFVYFPGGNLAKPVFMAGHVTMSQAGNAG